MPYTTEGKNVMLDRLGVVNTHVGAHTGVPSTGTPNEVSGGSPAYARKAIAWNASAGGSIDDTATSKIFDIPASTTVTHIGFWSASSGGTLYSYYALPVAESFGAQGTLSITDADQDLNA